MITYYKKDNIKLLSEGNSEEEHSLLSMYTKHIAYFLQVYHNRFANKKEEHSL